MSKFFNRFDKTYFLLIPLVLHTSWPWFAYRMRTIVPFVFFLIWFVFQRRMRADYRWKVSLGQACGVVLLFFGLHYYFQNVLALMGHSQFVKWFEYATTLTSVSHFLVIYCSFKYGKIRELKFLFVLVLVGTILAGVGSFRGGMIEGFEGGRALTTAIDVFYSNENIDNLILAYEIGAANYGTTYAFALFCVPLIWGLLKIKTKLLKFTFGLAVVASLLVVKNSGLGTPVFVALLGISFLFLIMLKVSPQIVMFLGSLVIIGLIVFAYNPKVFSILSPIPTVIGVAFEEGSSVRLRCDSIAEALQGDSYTYAAERYQLQARSINAFLDNPLIGTGIYSAPDPRANKVGGHSCLLDRLGQAGILGGFMYFGFLIALYMFYKRLNVCYHFERQWQSIIAVVLVCYVFSCVANPSPSFPAFLYYIPCIWLMVAEHSNRRAIPL